ncbi:MAG: PilZ domain-containing protein [Thermoanaerobaculales bacterium]|nr:PilZ domain-containing protein [Thermoanaerobaculales bacterium]
MRNVDFRRDTARAPLDPQVTVFFNDTADLECGGVRDISLGGMFIATATPYRPGSTFDFEINLADEVILIRGRAEVVWAREGDDSSPLPSGMGVRFVELDTISKGIIFRLVDRYIQTTGAEPFNLNAPHQGIAMITDGA